MVAALDQYGQNEQVRIREQPLICFRASGFRGARDESEMPAAGKIAQVIETNSCQTGDLIFGEELLTRFYGQHVCASQLRSMLDPH